MSQHSTTPQKPEKTRSLSYVTHTQLIEAYDAYVREIGKTPSIEIRGSVEFVQAGKRPDTWRKKREVDLLDWYEVREWKRDAPLLLIWYTRTGGVYRTAPEPVDQWVRPLSLFDHQWNHVRLSLKFADANAAYLAYRQHQREEGHI